jgi:hypothetical protein
MPTTARCCWIACLALMVLPAPIRGSEGEGPDPSPAGRALIVVGLPGDEEHEASFRSTAGRWRDWLTGPLGFPADRVRVLSGGPTGPRSGDAPSTRESIAREADRLRKELAAGDRLWVFVLGHANVEDGHAYLHLPGPDLSEDEFGALFREVIAGEQVFWMTTAASGRFLAALSKPGRIVVAATEREGEFNETEFPAALAEVSRMPVGRLDLDRDRRVSVREVFDVTVAAVNARFAADNRLPTEHAQLDDDGDGLGTELARTPGPTRSDGALASKTFLPTARPAPPPNPPARSDHDRK